MSDSIAKINMNINTRTVIPDIKMGVKSTMSFIPDIKMGVKTGGSGVKSYDQLTERPQINGVTLTGDKSLSELYIVTLDTTENWNADPEFVPKFGQVCVYVDYYGEDKPAIKIGDGNAYLIDLPIVGQQLSDELIQAINDHIANTTIHITSNERDFWNAKLNYEINNEELIFNRL